MDGPGFPFDLAMAVSSSARKLEIVLGPVRRIFPGKDHDHAQDISTGQRQDRRNNARLLWRLLATCWSA